MNPWSPATGVPPSAICDARCAGKAHDEIQVYKEGEVAYELNNTVRYILALHRSLHCFEVILMCHQPRGAVWARFYFRQEELFGRVDDLALQRQREERQAFYRKRHRHCAPELLEEECRCALISKIIEGQLLDLYHYELHRRLRFQPPTENPDPRNESILDIFGRPGGYHNYNSAPMAFTMEKPEYLVPTNVDPAHVRVCQTQYEQAERTRQRLEQVVNALKEASKPLPVSRRLFPVTPRHGQDRDVKTGVILHSNAPLVASSESYSTRSAYKGFLPSLSILAPSGDEMDDEMINRSSAKVTPKSRSRLSSMFQAFRSSFARTSADNSSTNVDLYVAAITSAKNAVESEEHLFVCEPQRSVIPDDESRPRPRRNNLGSMLIDGVRRLSIMVTSASRSTSPVPLHDQTSKNSELEDEEICHNQHHHHNHRHNHKAIRNIHHNHQLQHDEPTSKTQEEQEISRAQQRWLRAVRMVIFRREVDRTRARLLHVQNAPLRSDNAHLAATSTAVNSSTTLLMEEDSSSDDRRKGLQNRPSRYHLNTTSQQQLAEHQKYHKQLTKAQMQQQSGEDTAQARFTLTQMGRKVLQVFNLRSTRPNTATAKVTPSSTVLPPPTSATSASPKSPAKHKSLHAGAHNGNSTSSRSVYSRNSSSNTSLMSQSLPSNKGSVDPHTAGIHVPTSSPTMATASSPGAVSRGVSTLSSSYSQHSLNSTSSNNNINGSSNSSVPGTYRKKFKSQYPLAHQQQLQAASSESSMVSLVSHGHATNGLSAQSSLMKHASTTLHQLQKIT